MLLQQALESLQAPEHEQQKQQVITAIKDLGLKVTCGDVAVKTALPVLKVNELLNNIAYETQGHLAVDTAGGVMYKFDSNFESHYLLNPTKHFFAWAARIAWNTIKWALKLFVLATCMLLRISFGILLVLSVVLVIVLVVAVVIGAISSLFKDSDGGGGGDFDLGGGDGVGVDWSGGFDWVGGLRFWTIDWLWDWWYWGDYLREDPWYDNRQFVGSRSSSSTWGTTYGGSSTMPSDTQSATVEETRTRKTSSTNFLDNCFAVLFGAGDPNANWDTTRWGVVARAIKSHSGVVLLEDLAPYLDATDKNEDCMLPVLVRFNGYPEVSETGKLIYVFPTLMPENRVSSEPAQSSATADDLQNIYNRFLARQTVQKASENHAAALPPYVAKERRPLFGINESDAITVVCFAAVAIGGALWLMTAWSNVSYVAMLRPVLLAVAAYGGMFFLFPAMRFPFVLNENAKIAAENELRTEAAQRLARPDTLLRGWQAEATQLRTSILAGEAKRIAYTTEEDALAQQFAHPNSFPLKLN